MIRSCIVMLVAVLALVPLSPPAARAAPISCTPVGSDGFELCYQFDGTKGEFPEAGLTPDSKGNLYTVTFGALGGDAPGKKCSKSCGTADGFFGDGGGDLRLLHDFAAGDRDGAFPAGEIAVQKGHIIYGTTEYGPAAGCGGLGCGTAFGLVKPAGTQQYKENRLIKFCITPNCSDGAFPRAGLIADSNDSTATVYGTTIAGGIGNGAFCGTSWGGCGTVYRIGPGDTKPDTLYSFCTIVQNNLCADGALPESRLLRDKKGNLYGTTEFGGANGYGTVFQLAPDGTETVLYSFCSRANCKDGALPEAGVVMDSSGKNIFGTTTFGGAACDDNTSGCGVVFKLVPNGSGPWTETVLHTFAGVTRSDGSLPHDQLAIDGAGNLYGTTVRGGALAGGHQCALSGIPIGCGTVFTVAGAVAAGYSILHVFGLSADTCSKAGLVGDACDGTHPEGALLLQDDDQHLYGAARAGGTVDCRCGTLYRLDLTVVRSRLGGARHVAVKN